MQLVTREYDAGRKTRQVRQVEILEGKDEAQEWACNVPREHVLRVVSKYLSWGSAGDVLITSVRLAFSFYLVGCNGFG
jgi:hypothetical protein